MTPAFIERLTLILLNTAPGLWVPSDHYDDPSSVSPHSSVSNINKSCYKSDVLLIFDTAFLVDFLFVVTAYNGTGKLGMGDQLGSVVV
jgi:hypothetical protein